MIPIPKTKHLPVPMRGLNAIFEVPTEKEESGHE